MLSANRLLAHTLTPSQAGAAEPEPSPARMGWVARVIDFLRSPFHRKPDPSWIEIVETTIHARWPEIEAQIRLNNALLRGR